MERQKEAFLKELNRLEQYVKGLTTEYKKDNVISLITKISDLLADLNISTIYSQEGPFQEIVRNLLDNALKKTSYFFDAEINDEEFLRRKSGDLSNILQEFLRVKYLSEFKGINRKNFIIVGGNGAGKSTFVSFLRESKMNGLTVVPAQKHLFFNRDTPNIHLKTITEVRDFQQTNWTRFYQEDVDSYRFGELINSFTIVVSAFINKYIEELHSVTKQDKSTLSEGMSVNLLSRLNNIWGKVIDNISLDVDTTRRVIEPFKNGNKYSINAMSDGEKAILYYICHVLLASDKSFIVIDEPETYLNPAVANTLWNILESERQDCTFMYVSHDVDFVQSRKQAQMMWCKNFIYPDVWNFELITTDSFPRAMLTELLGSKKKVLFCEGDKKTSLDYQVYTSIFGEEYLIQPVGGHREVISYTRQYNESPIIMGNGAIGIIDHDYLIAERISEYRKDGIYVLPYNEVEMLLLDEDIMKKVISSSYPNQYQTKIDTFKELFFNEVKKIWIR